MKPYFIILIILWIVFTGTIIDEHIQDKREAKCYNEAVEKWNSVNTDYPSSMTAQEAYDRNDIQSEASMDYIVCINGGSKNGK